MDAEAFRVSFFLRSDTELSTQAWVKKYIWFQAFHLCINVIIPSRHNNDPKALYIVLCILKIKVQRLLGSV
jgi:hypothetical protein